jgi:hypothetical protein
MKSKASMITKSLFFIAAFMLISCSGTATLTPATEIPGILFSQERTEASASKLPVSGKLTPAFWTPTVEQVLTLEEDLCIYVREKTHYNRSTIGDLSRYKRQYLGITRNGMRKIYVNAFCDDYWLKTKDWLYDFILVLGGGDCYFQILYDPITNEFSDFVINGQR